MFGFVVVDDRIVAVVGNGFVVLVDGGVLGVDVGQIGAVVLVDVTIPCVVVDGDVVCLVDGCGTGDIRYRDGVVSKESFGVVGNP